MKRRMKLVYIIGIAVLLVSLCAGIFAVPQVYAGSPSSARHATTDSGGGSGGDGSGSGGGSGNSGTPIALEEPPVDISGEGSGSDTADEATTGDPTVAAGGPSVYTDKADYAPYETPVITGTGFAPNSEVTLTITAPDGGTAIVKSNTDSEGNFNALYEGAMGDGEFSVSATDGNNAAVTTFTDPGGSHYHIKFKQTGLVSSLVASGTTVLMIGSTEISYGSIGTSGYTIDRNSSDHVSYAYSTIVGTTSAGTRFELKSVDGAASGFRVGDYCNYNGTYTITGNYGKQYQLTIISAHGSTTPAIGSYWYDDGTQFRNNPSGPNQVQTPYVTPLEVTEGGNTYDFVEWTGDGPSNSNAEDVQDGNRTYTHNFNLDGPRTVTAVWTEVPSYYTVTFTQTGLESGLVNGVTLVLTVGATNVPYSDIDGAPWYTTSVAAGNTITYLYSAIVASNATGTQFALKSVSGLASGSAVNCTTTITGNYGKQYYLTVASNPNLSVLTDELHGSTSGWYDAGTEFRYNSSGDEISPYIYASSSPVYQGSDTRYQFANWSGDGGSDESHSGKIYTDNFDLNSPMTVTANWDLQYKLTVASDPSLSVLLNTLHGSDTGWYDAGTEFRWNPGCDQEKSPYINDSSTPVYVGGSHDTRYLFVEWTGDGGSDESHSGKTYTDNFDLNSPMTVTANWNTQYYLSVNNGGHGSVYGSGWYDENTDATFGVVSTTVPSSEDGKRYVFDDWNGSPCGAYNGSDPEYTITMTKHFVETATWDTQYRLIMYSTITDATGTVAGGTTDPSVGEHWYNAGTWVEIQAYAPTTVDGERYVWNGWTGTPEDDDDGGGCHHCCDCGGGCNGGDCEGYTGLGTGTTHSAFIKMNCPITETASWDHEYRLIMESYVTDATGTVAGGTTDPSVGEHWFLAGTDLDISAFAPALTYLDGERYTFDGWAGSGCGEYTGFDETAGITMNGAITEAATWLHEYRLTMQANYGTTTPSLGEHWYLAGLNVPITAISPVPLPFETYDWNGWTGTGCGSYTGTDNPSDVDMFSPVTQTASWIYTFTPAGGGNTPDENTGLVIVIDVEGNIVSYPVTPDGALLEDVVQNSPDGNLTLSIPVGTIVLNPDGTPAYLNPDPDVIGIQAGAVASAGDNTIIQAYDLTPSGLYFVNGQATLTSTYSPDNVPEGKSVTWAYYDASTNSWVDVETSGSVAAGGEPAAACTTSSLTVFALIAH
jgi:hypothetical protein